MTTLNKILGLLSLVAIIVIIILASSVVKQCKTDHSGSVWVKQKFLDSLQAIASLPPDTVKTEKIIKGEPIYVDKPYPVPVYTDKDSVKHYDDSLKTCDIDATVSLKVKGDLLDIQWKYRPITEQIIQTIKIPEPYPVRYEVPVNKPQSGLFLMTGIGKGFVLPTPIISGQVFYLTKTGRVVGLEAGYFQKSYFKVNFGIKF